MDPFVLLKPLLLAWRYWVKRIGLKWVLVGLSLSTVLAVILEHTVH